MRRLAVLSLIILAGCSIAPAPQEPPPPPFASGDYAPVRGYVTKNMPLSATVASDRPRAYVILDKSKQGDNRKLCEAFVRLPTEPDIINLATKPITTWWLTKGQTGEGRTCKQLVEEYDFGKATALRSAFGLGAKGIYILAVDQNNRALPINLTDANKSQMNDTALLWVKLAQEAGPAGSISVKSESLFDVAIRSFCDGKVEKVSADELAAAVGSGGTSILVSILVRAGKEFACKASDRYV